MAGMALAIFTYRPIFNEFLSETKVTNPEYFFKGDLVQSIANVTFKKINDTGDSLRTKTEDYKSTGIPFLHKVSIDTVYSDKNKQASEPKITYINKSLSTSKYWKFIGLVFILILYVTMVYGPIAAFLVEMFPTKIRYTSMSLPYHIGNGVFGGLVPFIGLLLTTTFPADPLVGLWYPIGVAALCLIIGLLYLTNKIDRNIKD